MATGLTTKAEPGENSKVKQAPAVSTFKAANPDAKMVDAWITGAASNMVKDQMAKSGGSVTDNVDNRTGFVF